MRRPLQILLGAFAALHIAGAGQAENALLPGIQGIIDRGQLTVAMIKDDVPPVIVTGKDGGPAGFEGDLAKAIAKDLGVTLKIVRTAETGDDVVSLVIDGKTDLAISFLSRTPRRAKSVLFSRSYLTQKKTALINRVAGLKLRGSCPTIPELLYVLGLEGKVGVLKGSANAARIKEAKPDAKVTEFDELDQLFDAVRNGKIAVSLQGELSARVFLKDNPSARIYMQYCELDVAPDGIGIAVGGGNHDLQQWLNVFLDEHNVDYQPADLISHKGPWTFF